jgi:eukaryotic-like serine/threonine-protein kinase
VTTDVRERLQEGLTGRYRLERKLGRGGMATVYLAQDLKHDRRVALKVLHPELAATLGPERFQREIKLAARLQHPHILSVFDSGETAGQLWFTMPYIGGESLRDRLRRERQLPIPDALQITREVADALGYAHRQGIVHRDIKPENILLSEGHALVADFGVARALHQAGGEQLTQTGTSVGTPAYMSPEQAMGDSALDGRSDLYSLGCVLYEMLTGEAPYTGPSAQAIVAKRLIDPVPSARRLRETVPHGVDHALQRVLAKAPADRFSTAEAFARALLASSPIDLEEPSPTSRAATRSERRPGMAVVWGAAILLVAIGAFFWRWSHRDVGATPAATGPIRLAVLPFENRGAPEDDYFADGLSDEVRGKLTAFPGLEVIARTSSGQYKHTPKEPRQIAQELGVRYLLTGTVRWEKPSAGPNRVRVSPELVEIGTRGAPSARWQAPFESALTDVFQVQADIAGQVAQALDLKLSPGMRQQLAKQPTDNLDAYEAYLKGLGGAGTGDLEAQGPEQLQDAITAFERAVAIDSSFALAWAQLGRARVFYAVATVSPHLYEGAREAVDRAFALDSTLPAVRLAVSVVYRAMLWRDIRDSVRYARECEAAWRLAPNDPDALTCVAWLRFDPARGDAAITLLERARALDPRSTVTAGYLYQVLMDLYRFPQAAEVADQWAAVAPGSTWALASRVAARLAEGRLAEATTAARTPPPGATAKDLLVAMLVHNLDWLLDEDQYEAALRFSPEPFGGDRVGWASALAGAARHRGDSSNMRTFAEIARTELEARLSKKPDNLALLSQLSQTYLTLGQPALALRALQRFSKQAGPVGSSGVPPGQTLGLLYARLNEPDSAAKYLALMITKHELDAGWFTGIVRFAPEFAAVRAHPRLKPLLDQLTSAAVNGN